MMLLYVFLTREQDSETSDINLEQKIVQTDNLNIALDKEIIILPVPVSFDGLYINTPYCDDKLTIKRFIEHINPSSL